MTGRKYPNIPRVGVGVVVVQNNKILLIKRGQEPSEGLWAFPGGLVELGEQLKEAVRREVKEECNIEINVGEVLTVLDLILKDEDDQVKFHYVLIDYIASFVSGELKPGSDVVDANWFSKSEVEKLDIPEISKQVIDKVFHEYV